MNALSTVTAARIKSWVGPRLKLCWVTKGAKYAGFGDTEYCLLVEKKMKDILDQRTIHEGQGELFDCDDFAFSCKAFVGEHVRRAKKYPAPLCFGIAWGRFRWAGGGMVDHACNWYVTPEKELRWFEPQTSEFFALRECVRGRLKLLLV